MYVNNAGRGINRSILEVRVVGLEEPHARDTPRHVRVRVTHASTRTSRHQVSDEDWDDMFNVNARSALYGMQTVYPYFKQREVCDGGEGGERERERAMPLSPRTSTLH